MKRRFIPVCEPTLRGNELKYVSDCVKTNWVSSFGKYIGEFEKGFSAYCGVNHGITCCNGSIAIHLALESAGIGPGDEVIVPDFTMIASVNSILYTGAKPVFVDAEMSTWCMNSNLIEEKITKRTKAILGKRLKITDQEILDETYGAYKKLTERKPYPTLKGIEFQLQDVAKRNPKAKGMKPEEFINISILKELDQSGFIDNLYKK